VANPAKNIPRGIFIGIAIIIGLYLLVNLSYFHIIGFENMKGESEIAYSLMNKVSEKQVQISSLSFYFFGVLAYVNALLMSNPRVMYAMSTEGALPKIFGKQSAKNDVLVFSLSIFASMCIVILFFAQTFDKILNFTIFLDCLGWLLLVPPFLF
jgi:APA family basic amino acid/polyamine antiporter